MRVNSIEKGKAEIWMDIVGYEGLYQVSSLGRVKGKKGIRILFDDTRGYLTVRLSRKSKEKTFKVHRLVATTFIPNFEGKRNVNHLDGNKKNNFAENLEWVTTSENFIHAYSIGLRVVTDKQREAARITGKSTCEKNRKRTPVRQIKDGIIIAKYISAHEASRSISGNASPIIKCCKGKKKTYYGYEWGYAQ